MRSFNRLFMAAAALAMIGLVVLPGAVLAQSSDSGTIDGRVFDESKAAMPGATVTAKNADTGLTRTAIASSEGTYRISALPSGKYDVSVDLSGFSTQVHQGVTVQVGSTSTVDFTMKVGGLAEAITVTGEVPLVQTSTSDVGQVITQTMIENLPMNGRKFQDLSLLVPGTRSANYYDPTKTEVGGISYGGATGRSVNITVDGGDNNDGVVRGLLQQFSADAIQEYKVTTQRFSAEHGRSTGGVVNVITKSGTNDFHGTAFVFARDERLNATTHFEKESNTEKSPFSQQQFGGTLGGPLKKDAAHFFLSYERNRRNEFPIVFTNGVLPEEEGPQEQPFRNHLLTAKLDFQLGSSNNAMVRYALEDNNRENDFIGGNTLKSAGASNTNKVHSAIAKNTSVIGSSTLNELSVLFQYFENNILSNDNTRPGVQTPDFYFGANLNTPQQTIQKRWQVRDDFSFRKQDWGGDHQFKVGAEIIKSHYGGFFIPTLYGWFNFVNPLPNLDAYLNGIADTFTGSAGTNVANDDWTNVAGYFQDDWKPSPKLTLNLGLRYEVQTGPFNNDFNTITRKLLRESGSNADKETDRNNFGPRLGFAYDVNGNAKTVIRGGVGRYYDEIFQNITLYENWSTFESPLFFVSASPANFTPNQFAADRENIRRGFLDPTFAGQQLRLTAPDLVMPYADQANLGFSVQANKYFALDIDYVFAKGEDEIHRWRVNTSENVNTRISPAGVFAPDPGGPFIVEGNRGHSKFHGLYVTGKVRHAKASIIATYAWSSAKNLGDGFNTLPGDITNADWESDWGYTPNDVRHRGTLGGVFQLPASFQYSTAFQYNTGKPFQALAGLGGLSAAVRAVNPATGQRFERNAFRAGNFMSWDMRLSKMFKFGADRSLEVLFEVFNLTDHVNFDRDDYTFRFTSANFGTPTQIIKNSQRQAEVGVRFRF